MKNWMDYKKLLFEYYRLYFAENKLLLNTTTSIEESFTLRKNFTTQPKLIKLDTYLIKKYSDNFIN